VRETTHDGMGERNQRIEMVSCPLPVTSEKDTLACCLPPLDTINFHSMNLHHYFCIGRSFQKKTFALDAKQDAGARTPGGTETALDDQARSEILHWRYVFKLQLSER